MVGIVRVEALRHHLRGDFEDLVTQCLLKSLEVLLVDPLYVGLGAAAAGAVILAFFGRTAAPEVVVRPDVARLSWRFSF